MHKNEMCEVRIPICYHQKTHIEFNIDITIIELYKLKKTCHLYFYENNSYVLGSACKTSCKTGSCSTAHRRHGGRH